MVLHTRGIGPNSASNGVWLQRSVHESMHTNAYYANVNMVVGKYHFNPMLPTAQLVRDLARVGQLLQKGQLPL
jgi:HNH/ENDO VII superfamily nuclease